LRFDDWAKLTEATVTDLITIDVPAVTVVPTGNDTEAVPLPIGTLTVSGIPGEGFASGTVTGVASVGKTTAAGEAAGSGVVATLPPLHALNSAEAPPTPARTQREIHRGTTRAIVIIT
jgi:hypothetical protein